MTGVKGHYPLRRQYAAEGLTLSQAAARLGIARVALFTWAQRHGVKFRDGRGARARKAGDAKGGPAGFTAPLSRRWFADHLTEGEHADYRLLRGRGGQSPVEALAALRRHDLVAEVSAWMDAQKEAAR